MADTFDLDESETVFLYGDNHIARRLHGMLRSAGYTVGAVLDRRYTSRKKGPDGTERLSLGTLEGERVTEGSAVIVCMASGISHESALDGLVRKGFSSILYLPMLINRPLQEQELIRWGYFAALRGDFGEVRGIPRTRSLSESGVTVIYRNRKDTAFLCPISLLRSATEKKIKEEVLPGREYSTPILIKNFKEVPLVRQEPYKQLFSYLMGKGDYPEEYLSAMRESEEERKLLLEDRWRLLKIYEMNYEYNFSFFLYSPAEADWNEGGYLNVNDGLHRSVYLMLKGKRSVPVVVSNEDFERILDAGILEETWR